MLLNSWFVATRSLALSIQDLSVPIKINMKILSVNNTADLYGASRCMERLLGRFTQDGHEVHAVLPERGRLADLLEARGVRVHTHRCLAILDRAQLRSLSGCLRFFFSFLFLYCCW